MNFHEKMAENVLERIKELQKLRMKYLNDNPYRYILKTEDKFLALVTRKMRGSYNSKGEMASSSRYEVVPEKWLKESNVELVREKSLTAAESLLEWVQEVGIRYSKDLEIERVTR